MKHFSWCSFSIFILTLILVSPAYAYRPLNTEDAGVLDPGRFELEAGHDYAEAGEKARSVRGLYTINAGVLPRFETDLNVPVKFYNETETHVTQGFDDLSMVGKLRILEESQWLPAFTAAGTVFFPSGDEEREIGTGKAGYQTLAVFGKTFGDWTFHYNAGWDFLDTAEDRFVSNIAGDYKITDRWHVVAEWDSASDFHEDSENEVCAVQAGFLWLPMLNLTIDVGARAGLVREDEEFRLTLGATYQI